jgi:hypothetical protein
MLRLRIVMPIEIHNAAIAKLNGGRRQSAGKIHP